jgi:hypothetical protein
MLTESEFAISYQKRFERLKESNDAVKFRPAPLLAGYLTRIKNNTLWEHRDVDEIVDFQRYVKTLDGRSAVSLAVGSQVSVIQFEPHIHSMVIEVRGNKSPKKIKDVMHDNAGNIDWIEFTDGSTFPDREFLEHGKGGGIHDGISTLFFSTYAAADKALMMATLYGSSGWTISTTNLEESVMEASGYIPSEKEKTDPRYSMALTVDINPYSIKKNAKAFGWNIKRSGIPPLLRK